MSRPRLRRRISAVSFTGRSCSGGSLLPDVTVKMSPPCPRRTLLTRTGSSASGRTITSPTSTSPAGITSSTNRDDTGQEDQLHLEGERTVSHMSTPGDVAPAPVRIRATTTANRSLNASDARRRVAPPPRGPSPTARSRPATTARSAPVTPSPATEATGSSGRTADQARRNQSVRPNPLILRGEGRESSAAGDTWARLRTISSNPLPLSRVRPYLAKAADCWRESPQGGDGTFRRL